MPSIVTITELGNLWKVVVESDGLHLDMVYRYREDAYRVFNQWCSKLGIEAKSGDG